METLECTQKDIVSYPTWIEFNLLDVEVKRISGTHSIVQLQDTFSQCK